MLHQVVITVTSIIMQTIYSTFILYIYLANIASTQPETNVLSYRPQLTGGI